MCRTLLLLDIEFRIQTPPLNRYGLEAVADGERRDAALRFLERFARVVGRRDDGDARVGGDALNQIIMDELTFDRERYAEKLRAELSSMNPEQRRAYDTVLAAVRDDRGGVFFLKAAAGT